MRRSRAMRVTVCSSMARYCEASLMLIVSVGTTPSPFSLFSHSWPVSLLLTLARGMLQRLQLALERPDAVEEVLHGACQRVGQVHLIEVDLALHTLPVTVCYPAGHAHDNRVLRDLPHHHRARADAAPRPDGEAPENLRPRPHGDVVAQGGMTLLPPHAGAAEGHALEQGHVLADLRRLADDDAHAVVDEEAPPQLGRGMDLDPGEEATQVGHEAGEGIPARVPEAMRHAVNPDRVDARIGQHHLELRARGGVTLHHRLHVVFHPLEHRLTLLLPACRRPLASGPSRPAPPPVPPRSPRGRHAPGPRGGLPPPTPPARPPAPASPPPPPPGSARSPRSTPRWSARSRRSGIAPPSLDRRAPAGTRARGPCTPDTRSPRPRRDPASCPHSAGCGSARSGSGYSAPQALSGESSRSFPASGSTQSST